MADITELLNAWSAGEEGAREELWRRLYGELSERASLRLRGEREGHTLDSRSLVHETFLRLNEANLVPGSWRCRDQFLALTAQVMRRVLVDHARRRLSAKRGGPMMPLSLEESLVYGRERAPELVALDDALEALAQEMPEQAHIVELRFFGGLSLEEVAAAMDLSVPTITRRWRLGRAWLYRFLRQDGDPATRNSLS